MVNRKYHIDIIIILDNEKLSCNLAKYPSISFSPTNFFFFFFFVIEYLLQLLLYIEHSAIIIFVQIIMSKKDITSVISSYTQTYSRPREYAIYLWNITLVDLQISSS